MTTRTLRSWQFSVALAAIIGAINANAFASSSNPAQSGGAPARPAQSGGALARDTSANANSVAGTGATKNLRSAPPAARPENSNGSGSADASGRRAAGSRVLPSGLTLAPATKTGQVRLTAKQAEALVADFRGRPSNPSVDPFNQIHQKKWAPLIEHMRKHPRGYR